MKKYFLFFAFCLSFGLMLQAQIHKTIQVTAGGLYDLTNPQANTITSLTLTGTIDARDFKILRDKLPYLSELDLSQVNIVAYQGDEGPREGVYKDYPAHTIPELAFSKNTATTILTSIVFPQSITGIGTNAFNSCNGLTDIVIPLLVTKIEHSAFANCIGLKTLTINSSAVSMGNLGFANCVNLKTITAASSIPYNLSVNVFYKVDKSLCVINVPYQSAENYRNALLWSEFQNIMEATNGFSLSANNVKLNEIAGSNNTITVSSNIEWTLSTDQNWLVVSPLSGNGLSQPITLTADENPSFINIKTAFITLSAPGVKSQVITVTQSVQPQSPKTLDIHAGGLLSALTVEELGSIIDLTLTGTIDARDFKTMRDQMPLLTKLDISEVDIMSYEGTGGTMGDNYNYFYPDNAIPSSAFSLYSGENNHLVSLAIPPSIIGFAENVFYEGFISLKVFWQFPSEVNVYTNFSTIKDKCTLYVPYGTASRYATAAGWKDFVNIEEAPQGFTLSLHNDTIAGEEGTITNVDIAANIPWSISCDQEWLTVNHRSGNENQQLLFTASANNLFTKRTATVTVTGEGVSAQSITIVQDIQPQPEKILELTAGNLASALNTDELNTISILTLKGTIDARDFKTMRDKMPLLAKLDLSGATIVAYVGTEGTGHFENYYSYLPHEIPERAFYGYNPLTGQYFGKSRLTSIVLPTTLTSIGNSSFSHCNGLTNITIPPLVAVINYQAFYHCESLTTVVIPSSVKTIEHEAFGFCKSLTSVTIPYGVESIGSYAFWFCTKLTSVIISSSVTSLGSYAFYECLELSQVTVNWPVPLNIGEYTYVFSNNSYTNIAHLNVPYKTLSGYAAADQWKDFINIHEMSGFFLLTKKVKLEQMQGSTVTLDIDSNVEWTASSDQAWLSVSPASGTGAGQKLTITAAANPLYTPRIALVTVSAPGVESKVVTVTQSPIPKQIEVIAGGLASTLTVDELQTITELIITGIIDARDFKTMRDKMPQLVNLDLSGATIAAYTGSEGTNPWNSASYPANKIPEFAFYRNTLTPSLSSIIFPPSITAIGRDAFYQCNGLVDIVIPPNVTSIEGEAFYNCRGLKTLFLPSSVFSLGTQCFSNCLNLASITVNCFKPPDLSYFYDVFYQVDKRNCILNVPYLSAVDYRNAYQWSDFQNIVEAKNGFRVISNNVNVDGTVGSTATIEINGNIQWTSSSDQNWLVVDPTSGDGLSQVLTFTAEANPSYINPRTANVTITVPGGLPQTIAVMQYAHPQSPKTWEATPGGLASAYTAEELATIYDLTLTGTIDARDFKTMRDKMPLLREIDISGATIVAYNGTEGTSHLGNTDYPPHTIPEYAFVQKVYALQGKGNLASIVLPESLTAFGQYSFYGCYGLTDLIIPASVTEIGSYAFFNCNRLGKFTISSAVTNIGTLALGRLSCEITVDPENQYYSASEIGLFNKEKTQFIQSSYVNTGSYVIPSTVTSIGDYAFYVCPKLTSVIIPSSVTSIGKYAFSNGSGLTTITIPSSVTFIGELAFAWRYGLKTIYVNSMTPVNLESSPSVFLQFPFYDCTLYVPTDSKNAYQTANQWKDFQFIVEVNPDLIANAGEDQIINEGTLGSLKGAALANTSGRPLTFQWTAPEGITLSSDTESNPTFTAPEVTMDQDFTFSLIISDGENYSTADQILVKVRNTIKAPIVKAGADQSVNENSLVTLDGSTSVDPNGYFLYYEWIAPFSISLSSTYSSKTTFQAPEVTTDTDFTFFLRAMNGYSYTTDTVVITIKQVNKVPISNAGDYQYQMEGAIVTLYGNSSTDPDGDALTYLWTSPEGISLNSNTSEMPSFTAPEVNEDTFYTFTLVVNDGNQNSATSEVIVLVKQIHTVLILITKANNLPVIFPHVNYNLFKKEGDTFIQKRDSFMVFSDTTRFFIEPGEWIVLASPADNSSAFVPTYAGNVISWTEAEIINIADKTTAFREITCRMPETSPPGVGQISGFVYEKPGSGTTSVSMSKTLKLLDKPFPNALVLLYRMGGTIPVASSFTDSEGAYQFDKLELSDYEIVIELPGFIQSDKFTITLSEKEPEANAYFGVDISTKVITDTHSIQLPRIKIYPNPTIGEIHIGGLQANLKKKLTIYSIAGNLVLEKTIDSTNETIDLSNLVSGTYLLMINQQTFKIVKK